ncbi:6164_t:CDS:1, partial [Dentiscutata erythropus]
MSCDFFEHIPTKHELLCFKYPELKNKTGFEPGDVFAIGDIMDEVDSVTELYVLRAQVTNKSYGISTWVRFTNFEIFFDVLVPSTHPNPNAYCQILINMLEYTNAKHPNGSW